MFLPRTLPPVDDLHRHRDRYPDLDATALHAFIHLLTVVRDAFEIMEPFFREKDVSQGRFCLLMMLFKAEGHAMCPAELAETMAVTRATVTGLVDGLEKSGLVERRPHPSDRRRIRCHLTEAGRKLMRTFLPGHFRRVARIMGELDEGDRVEFERLLGAVGRGLAAVREEAAR